MFSHELVTNPWMYYSFQFPDVNWFDAGRHAWMGKYFAYRTMAVFYSGWFGSLLDSDRYRRELYKAMIPHFKLNMGMGTHPRLGEASIFRVLAGVPEILGVIARQY